MSIRIDQRLRVLAFALPGFDKVAIPAVYKIPLTPGKAPCFIPIPVTLGKAP